jgi:TadE-like protein
MSVRPPTCRTASGQSLVEFLVAMFGFGLLLLGLFQALLFYRAKATVDYAALEAARAGAVHGAKLDDMKYGLARGLAPLYVPPSGAGKLGAGEAYGLALKDVKLLGLGRINVISPTRAAFNEFKETQWDGRPALPNDSLYFRSTTAGASGLSVQDANILKIKVTYDYPLIVPVIDQMLRPFGARLDVKRTLEEGHTVYSLPIVSSAMVRMQSPIYDPAALP